MKIHIITRCTRPENLRQIRESIFQNKPKAVDVVWNVVFDCKKVSTLSTDLLGDLKCKNTRFHFTECGDWKCQYHFANNLLTHYIRDGFVYFVDDDNILHQNFYSSLLKLYAENPNSRGFVFSQWVGGNDFSGVDIRFGKPDNIKVGSIDLAQFVFGWELPFEYRTLFGNGYCGDGDFIVGLFQNGAKSEFTFTDEILSYYNYISEYGDTDPTRLEIVNKKLTL
jgi:hypothetical protein